MQDSPAFNHLGYTQGSNLMNRKPNPNPITLTVWFVLIKLIIHANCHFASKNI